MQITQEPECYIGVDESGKGDYFGPLVIAGVYLGPDNGEALKSLDILESKRISDNRAISLSAQIKEKALSSTVVIGPVKYNELYGKIRNLNRLLGWGHARVIENILTEKDCPAAVSDQFGDEKIIIGSLQKRGKLIKMYQMPRAEKFLAVAAASVLARGAFLNYLKKLAHQYGITLPKGASNLVDTAGRQFIATHGVKNLPKVAKMHFKNSKKIGAV